MNRNRVLAAVAVLLLCALAPIAAQACDTALLIVDIQTFYLSNNMLAQIDGLAILPRVAASVDAAREAGIPIIYAKNLDPRLEDDDPALDFPEMITPLTDDTIIEKRNPDPFKDTELKDHLVVEGISRILLCGIWSTCCIDGSILSAKREGIEVIVIADAHADAVTRIADINELNETWDAMDGVSTARLKDIDFAALCP